MSRHADVTRRFMGLAATAVSVRLGNTEGTGLKPDRKPAAAALSRTALAPLLAILLASCTSASGPQLQTAGVSHSSAAALSSVETKADAKPTITAEGDAAPAAEAFAEAADKPLPEKVAAAPGARPETAAKAAKQEESQTQVASAEEPAKPQAVASESRLPTAPAGAPPLVDKNKESFLSAFFGNGANGSKSDTTTKPLLASEREATPEAIPAVAVKQDRMRPPGSGSVGENDAPKPIIRLASVEKPISASATNLQYDKDNPLPGVRQSSLFEIKRKSGLDDDSDVDVNEDTVEGGYQVASASGLARLAPNGLLKQRESVDTACLKPGLVRSLKQAEAHFGKKLVITSGYRSPAYNRKVNGARKSMHMQCAAADIQMAGVSKWELANYFRAQPGRGGVGTYCNTQSIHVDVGPERDWNWRCSRKG